MKIRKGFVSNSSSTSFCIYGICQVNDILLQKLIDNGVAEEELTDNVMEYIDEWDYKYHLKENGMSAEDAQAKCDKRSLAGMETHDPMSEGDIFIGKSWDSIKDDETGAQFKARIEKQLKKVFGNDIEFGSFEEAWRNG